MTRLFRSTALVTIFAAAPALADLTVDDAWAVWKAQFQAYGLTLDASEARDGDALQIGDIKLSATLPEGVGSGYVSFPGPRFTPADGGMVAVQFPKMSQLSLGGEIKGEGSFAAAVEMTSDNNPGLMSGDPNNVKTVWNSPGFELTLLDVALDGQKAVDVTGSFTFGPIDVSNATVIEDDHVTITAQSKFDSYDIAYDVRIENEAGDFRFEAGGGAKTVVSNSKTMLPRTGIDPLGLHTQLRDGLRLVANTTAAQSGSYQRMFFGDQKVSDQETKGEDYAIDVLFNETGFNYGGTTGAFAINMQMPELPFPISLAGESVGFRLLLPLLKSETAQKAALKMALNGVTLDEGLWGLFDPTTQLPRDPMTIAFDLGSEASLLFEFLDIRAMMGGAKPAGLPVTADRVTLNSLMVSAAGAELTGTGDFTLDYTDWVTFDGMPAPEGQAAFMLKGGNGLIDRLIAMGLMSQDDAMGMRMMMSMFAKPGAGEDVLTSEIDVKKTGEVSANGQRLR